MRGVQPPPAGLFFFLWLLLSQGRAFISWGHDTGSRLGPAAGSPGGGRNLANQLGDTDPWPPYCSQQQRAQSKARCSSSAVLGATGSGPASFAERPWGRSTSTVHGGSAAGSDWDELSHGRFRSADWRGCRPLSIIVWDGTRGSWVPFEPPNLGNSSELLVWEPLFTRVPTLGRSWTLNFNFFSPIMRLSKALFSLSTDSSGIKNVLKRKGPKANHSGGQLLWI